MTVPSGREPRRQPAARSQRPPSRGKLGNVGRHGDKKCVDSPLTAAKRRNLMCAHPREKDRRTAY
eukprot:2058805-Prymnesium_polylepis.1